MLEIITDFLGFMITAIVGVGLAWFRYILLPMISWIFRNYKEPY